MPLNSKVLLVEDSKLLRIASERALVKAGYQVSTAADGEEALQVALEQLPDIILLDMLLPKLSGPEVLKALKQHPATIDIPVVVLSSLSQKNEEKLLEAGAIAYFQKSALQLDKNSDRLAAEIEKVLARAKRQKELDLRLRQLAAQRAEKAQQAAPTEAVWSLEDCTPKHKPPQSTSGQS